jgi:hypothetical protein
MHSQIHLELAHAVADSRVRRAYRGSPRRRPERPPSPPARARVAYAAARLARRLDPEMARRAVV